MPSHTHGALGGSAADAAELTNDTLIEIRIAMSLQGPNACSRPGTV
jgi:hypothetical protein